MKVVQWWKLSSDESDLVMKVKIVKEVKKSDGLWRFACGDVFFQNPVEDTCYIGKFIRNGGQKFAPARYFQ